MEKVVLGLGVLVFMAAIAFFSINPNQIIKRAIETAGSNALGVSVTVGSVDFSIKEKSFFAKRLSIKNPSGFSAPYLIKTEGVSSKLGNVSNDQVTIDEVIIEGVKVYYELGANGSNLDVLKKQLKTSSSVTAAKQTDRKSKAPRMVLQTLILKNVELNSVAAGVQQKLSVGDIRLNNLGSNQNPITPEMLSVLIMNRVLSMSSLTMLQGQAEDVVKGVGKEVTDQLKDQMDRLPLKNMLP